MGHQRTIRASIAASAIALATVVGVAAPAHAATANGCSGDATSARSGGAALDAVAAPGAGGTRSDPFTIEPDGPVSWQGSTTGVIQNGSWKVTSSLFSTSDTFDNDDGNQDSEGTKKLSDYVPAALVLPGVYEVKVTVTGEGGTCTASGFVEVDANPLANAWTLGSLLLLAISGVVLNAARGERAGGADEGAGDPEGAGEGDATAADAITRHVGRGLLGGLLLGLSLSILSMAFGLTVVGSVAALMVILVGLLLGVVTAFAVPARSTGG